MNKLPWDSSSLRYDQEKKDRCDELRSKLPKRICPMPFTTLIVNPDGRVGFCRERTNNDVVGNIKEESLFDIWNGEKMRSIRREFLEGKIKTCASQIRDRRCYEQCFNQTILPYTDFSEYQKNPPLRLSPDFNGQCNLRCVTCNIWALPNGLYDEIGFWEMAEEKIFPHLKMLDPLAGEPFIQKDFFRLIDLMYEKNPDCAWRFTTNAHWKFEGKIREALDKVKNIYGFIISVDAATPETYHKVRYPGNLHLVWETIDHIIAYREERIQKYGPSQKFGITVAMAVHEQNWHEAPMFMRWAHSKGIEPGLQGVYLPENISIFKIDEDTKRREILDFFIKEMDYRDLIHIFRITTPLMASLGADLEKEYKQRIVNAYFEKELRPIDLWECGESFPRFLETFSQVEQNEMAIRILDYSLEKLTYEHFKKGHVFFKKLISVLNSEEQKNYQHKLLQFAKKNVPELFLASLSKN